MRRSTFSVLTTTCFLGLLVAGCSQDKVAGTVETKAAFGNTIQDNYLKGVSSALQGHFTIAEDAFEAALAADPNNQESRFNLGIVSDVLEKRISEKTGLHLFRAIRYGNEGNLAAKLSEQDSAIAESPAYALAYNDRGITYYDLGRFEEAVADRDQAIKLKPDYYEAYFNKALACEKLQRYQDAINAFRGFAEYAPPALDMHISYAMSRIQELETTLTAEATGE